MLLVDHNVKSVAALVDRVLAMYLGEEIVTGRADEVMRNETVRRVYLGGAIETSARPETSFKDKVPLLQVENVSVHYGKAQALENVSIHVHRGRVRLGRRPQRRRQDHAVQYDFRLPALLPAKSFAVAKSCAARARRASRAAASCSARNRGNCSAR